MLGNVLILIAALVVSLILVIKSADIFVDNLVDLGSSLGISEVILGVTASAIGTSLPEFGSALIASLSGSTDIGVGCVIGSNIWNIAGILGISALVAGVIETNADGLKRDFSATLMTGLILLFFMFFGNIGRLAAVAMVLLYSVYLWRLIKAQKSYSDENSHETQREPLDLKKLALTVVGFTGLVIGCRILVYSGVELADIAGIPAMIMGLFTLAIGTSIPELVVTLSSAVKGLHELSIGTVLGSNTFNILVGIGVPALIAPVPVEPLSLRFDAPIMILVTVLLVLLIKQGDMKLKRSGGIILLAVYISYVVMRLFVLA
ncbi:calcium/sodium antiporter [Methanothermobacter marburgensis]|uniref:Predicted cation antiporter n=2 Tax=Methanothermobacter TaxID=145260 RepID=D9PY20_METTM|nr:calcium/sodium antiporter [Methanothermobacter marburgensis]ADL59118.1 predicted cation antiporter [Methanothermobacter marburgensis str. Marburg]WBF09634.1 calcium/sodium antiporter [Methanothermobacter marburgensis]